MTPREPAKRNPDERNPDDRVAPQLADLPGLLGLADLPGLLGLLFAGAACPTASGQGGRSSSQALDREIVTTTRPLSGPQSSQLTDFANAQLAELGELGVREVGQLGRLGPGEGTGRGDDLPVEGLAGGSSALTAGGRARSSGEEKAEETREIRQAEETGEIRQLRRNSVIWVTLIWVTLGRLSWRHL